MRSDAAVFITKLMINEYCKFSHQEDLNDEQAMIEMLVDMRHFCASKGINFNMLIGQSYGEFISDELVSANAQKRG